MRKGYTIILCLALASLACSLVVPSAGLRVAPAPPARTIIKAPTAGATTRTCARVIAETAQNLRELADLSSKILVHLQNGEVVQVLDQDNSEWWKVQRGDDVGFARSRYLQEVKCEVSDGI